MYQYYLEQNYIRTMHLVSNHWKLEWECRHYDVIPHVLFSYLSFLARSTSYMALLALYPMQTDSWRLL